MANMNLKDALDRALRTTKQYIDENDFSGDYNDLTNKPVYDNSETKHYAYDGNQNDKTVVLISNYETGSQSYVKISDDVLTYEQFTNASIVMSSDGDFYLYDLKDLSKEEFESMVYVVENETGKAVVCQNGVCAIHNDNFTMTDLTFPEKGLYVIHMAITSATEASTSSFDKVISTFGAATGDVYVSDVYVETIDLKQLEEKFIPDTIARVANLPYCDTRTTEPAVITYDGNQSDKQVIVFKQDEDMQHAFVRINDSLSTIEAYEMISMSITYSDGRLGDAFDIEIKRVNNDVVLLGYEDSHNWYIANVCSEFNMKTSLAISEDCILTEGLWFYQISEIDNAASLSNEIEAKVTIFSHINEFKYNKTIDGDWKQVDEYDNLTTKKYVDDAIFESVFSGDYNDLENRPCYDDVVVTEGITFDGLVRETDETVPMGEGIYVKKSNGVMPIEDFIGKTIKYSGDEEAITITDDDIQMMSPDTLYLINAGDIVVAYDTYVGPNNATFNKGIYFFTFEDAGEDTKYVSYLECTLEEHDIKLLDEKFVSYKPGKRVDGETFTVTLNPGTDNETQENRVAKQGAEIFNADTNIAIGEYSHAEGENTSAISYAAHAEGYGTIAGQCSHAEGHSTQATGSYSHAEGRDSIASGMYAHAEGKGAEAIGDASHSEGLWTVASGLHSHAEGRSTIAAGENQHVQGIYNIEDTEGKYAHIVGNGTTDANRKNAHTLDWDGNAWFQGNVSIDGTPTNDNDLTTKVYVDNVVANATPEIITEEDINAIIANIDN